MAFLIYARAARGSPLHRVDCHALPTSICKLLSLVSGIEDTTSDSPKLVGRVGNSVIFDAIRRVRKLVQHVYIASESMCCVRQVNNG